VACEVARKLKVCSGSDGDADGGERAACEVESARSTDLELKMWCRSEVSGFGIVEIGESHLQSADNTKNRTRNRLVFVIVKRKIENRGAAAVVNRVRKIEIGQCRGSLGALGFIARVST